MSMDCKLLSHPGKYLRDHLIKVLEIGSSVFKQQGIFTEYENILKIILLFHDLGKASNYFQIYIKDPQNYNYNTLLKAHSEISALWAYYYIKNQLQTDLKTSSFAYIAIKKHHGDIENYRDNFIESLDEEILLKINESIDYRELNNIYSEILPKCSLSNIGFNQFYSTERKPYSISRKIENDLSAQDYLLVNYLFSILVYSDKEEAIFSSNQTHFEDTQTWKSEYIKNYKKNLPKTDNEINRIRERSFDEVENNLTMNDSIFSINLPTGAGKTLTALNAAIQLKSRNKSIKRIIYCLPFTSVIDQNASIIEEIMKTNNMTISNNSFLKHHHLVELRYTNNEDEIYKNHEAAFLIESWQSELIITTFYQFAHTFFSNRNKALKKFHALANAIIILDEIQNFPSKYWGLVNEFFQLATRQLNMKFILMSATIPLIFSEEDRCIKELAASKIGYFKSLNRIAIDLSYLKTELRIEDFANHLIEEIKDDPKKSRLIILNTIQASLDLYLFLKKNSIENLIYLSTNIIPKHRLQRIRDIKEKPTSKIIISTQLVEAGVDIDVDIIYRDMAPLDSIFQSCGRCNRNNLNQTSIVKIILLKNQNDKKYYSFIYDNVLIEASKKAFANKEIIPENSFYELSHEYYNNLKSYLSQDKSRKLIDLISKLQYNDAFRFSKNNEDEFHLFDYIETRSVFIEYDEDASKLFSNFKDMVYQNRNLSYEQSAELKSIFRQMSSYIINIPPKFIHDDKDFIHIPIEDVKANYSFDTGWKRDQDIEDYIC